MFSLRVAGIAGVMAVVASMSVMAQTTGTISAPSANLPASVAAADRKSILVQRNNRRRTPFFRQRVTRPRHSCRESGEPVGPAERLYSW